MPLAWPSHPSVIVDDDIDRTPLNTGIVSSVAADPQDRVYVIDRESDPQF